MYLKRGEAHVIIPVRFLSFDGFGAQGPGAGHNKRMDRGSESSESSTPPPPNHAQAYSCPFPSFTTSRHTEIPFYHLGHFHWDHSQGANIGIHKKTNMLVRNEIRVKWVVRICLRLPVTGFIRGMKAFGKKYHPVPRNYRTRPGRNSTGRMLYLLLFFLTSSPEQEYRARLSSYDSRRSLCSVVRENLLFLKEQRINPFMILLAENSQTTDLVKRIPTPQL